MADTTHHDPVKNWDDEQTVVDVTDNSEGPWYDVPHLATPDRTHWQDWLSEAHPPTERYGYGEVSVDTADRIAQIKDEFAETTQTKRARRRRAKVVVAVATGVVAVGLIATGVVLLGSDGDTAPTVAAPPLAATPTSATQPSQPPAAATPANLCPAVSEGGRVSGNGAGDTTTAVGQIFYSQYQMYVDRNADAARSVFAPGAAVAPLDATRAAIAAIPAGTTHCVHVLTLSPTEYAVTIDERHVDGSTQRWDNRITVGPQPDGRPLITAINPAPTG